jgi:hypothetical protein
MKKTTLKTKNNQKWNNKNLNKMSLDNSNHNYMNKIMNNPLFHN